MLSTLGPAGLAPGHHGAAWPARRRPLYIPAITQVREGLGRRGLLYIGDCKMGALQTRAFTQAGGDYYLCPLSEVQLPPEVLEEYLAPVDSGEQSLTDVYREKGRANGNGSPRATNGWRC